ncbi:MAG: hypothetical protein IKP47_02805 [Ruminococcus sp.]|nr:hypothetical protein [Ruminococcus sp.]
MIYNIVLNPAGASGNAAKLWQKLEPMFSAAGADHVLYRSSPGRSIRDICRELTSKGTETVLVVIGGDGSFNEAVNGIEDFKHTLFGFIPCGTGNDMRRDMSLPRSPKDVARLILEGRERRRADVGLMRCVIGGNVVTRRFNISSDIGFGAATCAFADSSGLKARLNRLHLGRLIYLIGALKVCFTAETARVTISCGGHTRVYPKCLSAIVMNHCHEGGGFKFCPDADFTDGLLDLCAGTGLTKPGYLRMLPNAYRGKHLRLRGIYAEKAKRILMTSDRPLWIHTDGEVLGKTTRAEMSLLPDKLRLLV